MSIKSAKTLLYFSKLFFNPNNKISFFIVLISFLLLGFLNIFLIIPLVYLLYKYYLYRSNKLLFIMTLYCALALFFTLIKDILYVNFFVLIFDIFPEKVVSLNLFIGLFLIPVYFILRAMLKEHFLISTVLLLFSSLGFVGFSTHNLYQLLLTIVSFELFIRLVDYLSNKHLKIKTSDTLASLLDFWYDGKDEELNRMLSRIGSEKEIETFILSVPYRKTHFNIVIPQIHFGPVSSIGSGDFTKLLRERETEDNKYIILHTSVTHNSNIVVRSQVLDLANHIINYNKGEDDYKDLKVRFSDASSESAKCVIVDFNEITFILFSNYPNLTEDITEEFGHKLVTHAKQFFKSPVIVDSHDCDTDEIWYVDEKSKAGKNYFDAMKEAINKIIDKKFESCHVKFLKKDVNELEELGSNGICIIQFSTKNEKWLFIVFDSNSIAKELRSKLELLIKKYASNFVFCSTDTHEINLKRGITNPLADEQKVIPIVEQMLAEFNQLKEVELRGRFGYFKSKVKIVGNSLVYSKSFAAALILISLIIIYFVLTGILETFFR
ncbi:MAG: DUF2070 family protein [Candidatus Micrarchaeota archaeon]|nr:DUF2070 family protein [Candidatus Micrarchaeota archaeon]